MMEQLDYFKNKVAPENDGEALLKHRDELLTKLRTGGLTGMDRREHETMLRVVLDRMALHDDFSEKPPAAPVLVKLEAALVADKTLLEAEANKISLHLIGKKKLETKDSDDVLRNRLMAVHQAIIAHDIKQQEVNHVSEKT